MKWSQPSTYAQTGVHHGYSTMEHRGDSPIPDAVKVWWGRLEPGGFIVPHIDKSPWRRRWHYPVLPSGYVWDSDGTRAAPSEPFAMRHHEPHAVWVPPDQPPRLHLIAEFDDPVPGESPLTMCGMIDPIAELIERYAEMTLRGLP